MIACKICESTQFLQIIESNVKFEGGLSDPTEVYERYECMWCGPTAIGALTIYDNGEKHLTGSIIEVDKERPRSEI